MRRASIRKAKFLAITISIQLALGGSGIAWAVAAGHVTGQVALALAAGLAGMIGVVNGVAFAVLDGLIEIESRP